MPLINVIIILVVVGVGLWAVNTYIPMAKPIKKIVNFIVVILVCLWLLEITGTLDYIKNFRVR